TAIVIGTRSAMRCAATAAAPPVTARAIMKTKPRRRTLLICIGPTISWSDRAGPAEAGHYIGCAVRLPAEVVFRGVRLQPHWFFVASGFSRTSLPMSVFGDCDRRNAAA